MNNKDLSSETGDMSTTEHLVIECPDCRTRFSLNALTLQGIEEPRCQCSDCGHIFFVQTKKLQTVTVISNNNPPALPVPQSKRGPESESRAVNDWQAYDATFTDFVEPEKVERAGSEIADPVISPFMSGEASDYRSETTEVPVTGSFSHSDSENNVTVAQPNGDSWTLGSISPEELEEQKQEFTFEFPAAENKGPSDDAPVIVEQEIDLAERERQIEEMMDNSATPWTLDPVQQELPFKGQTAGRESYSRPDERYREKDTVHFPRQQVFVAPGEMGSPIYDRNNGNLWKGSLWIIAPVIAMLLLLWGFGRQLHSPSSFSGSLIDSFMSGTPEVAPAGLIVDEIRLEKLVLADSEQILLLSGRLKNKTLKTFKEVILESRILVDEAVADLVRATAFSPLPHTDVRELSAELLKELQTRRAARIQKLEPGQELHFQIVLSPGLIEDHPVHSTRIYSVEVY